MLLHFFSAFHVTSNGTPSFNGRYSVQHTIKIKKKKNNQCLNSSLFQLVIFYVECSLAGLAKNLGITHITTTVLTSFLPQVYYNFFGQNIKG